MFNIKDHVVGSDGAGGVERRRFHGSRSGRGFIHKVDHGGEAQLEQSRVEAEYG